MQVATRRSRLRTKQYLVQYRGMWTAGMGTWMAAVSCANRRMVSAVLRVCRTSKPSYTAVVTPAVRTACRSDGADSTAGRVKVRVGVRVTVMRQ